MRRSGPVRKLLSLAILFLPFAAVAARISGSITDSKGEPLGFANVVVEGSSYGTTANSIGMYSLEVSPGTYRLVFRLIGFQQKVEEVTVTDQPVTVNVVLKEESYLLKEVTIKADAEDPAYAIIRKAQQKREDYLKEVSAFSCESYVKSVQKLTSYPKKFMGQDVDLGDMIDSASGIFYLSESVSKISFRQPDKVSEEMISSKVSGSPRSYSFNRGADLVRMTFYESLLKFGGLAPRGIVSPVASNSIFFYKFRLEGTFVENGRMINKINVIPKRPNDPVFTGDIYIVEDSWRIHSADLFITKAQQLEFIDTFRVRQSVIPIDGGIWMPFSTQILFHFGAFGFLGEGNILGVFKDYNLQPGIEEKKFSGEILRVNAEANKRDSSYWESTRPVPLTLEESVDYHRKDSTRLLHESKPYRDSVDRTVNKFQFGELFTGYRWQDSYNDRSITVNSPLMNIQFNTVEGWNLSMSGIYNKGFGETDNREMEIEPYVRYGFSNGHLNGNIRWRYRYDPVKLSTVEVKAGTAVTQFNAEEPISQTINSVYSLLDRKNYMKIYEERFAKAEHRSELFNGFGLGLTALYSQRSELNNTTDYSFSGGDRVYSSNDPVRGNGDTVTFESNRLFEIGIKTRIRFGQRYITRPEGKYLSGTRYPTIRLEYRKAIKIADDAAAYDFVRVSVEDVMDVGLLGELKYKVAAGDFITSKSVPFMDYAHFNGNRTWFSSFRINDFLGLEYYRYSTTDAYFEAHAEQHFHGFLLNKIPFIRKLKLDEVVTVNYLMAKEFSSYMEIGAGIEKLNAFRFQVFNYLDDGKWGTFGVVFGLKKSFGF